VTETMTTTLAPVVKTVHVGCSLERAFEVFTREIGSWWPLDQLALHPGEVAAVTWEEREGGEIYETSTGGERSHWATVLAWDPPAGFILAWRVDPDAVAATEVEVRFTPDGNGTRVVLEHRHWERLGVAAAAGRGSYEGGWEMVLGRYTAAAA
jgi:uncharacterized protein YndB with AHSA1/START domain